MGILSDFQQESVEIRKPSEAMLKIRDLIDTTESRVAEIEDLLLEKKRTLSECEACKALDPTDRSSAIRSSLAKKTVNSLENELSEKNRIIEGLNIRYGKAVEQEKKRIYGEIVDRIRAGGVRLLELIDKLDVNIAEKNELTGEISRIMDSTFWHEEAAHVLHGLCQLPPEAVRKTEPIGQQNFLDRLKRFLSDE